MHPSHQLVPKNVDRCISKNLSLPLKMSVDPLSANRVFVFSPPKRNGECEVNPSEFLLLKPFSKAPSLQIDINAPGESKTVTLTVQNIDDNPSRLYFEIPAEKNIAIRPETAIIQPQSIEVLEIIATAPKESFRATIKVFAPDIKYYRGGQFSVAVNVKKILKTEKKKKRARPVAPIAKPKAVTVPEEFTFQPSREERKKIAAGDKPEGGDNDLHAETLDIDPEIVASPAPDLTQLHRQTVAFKQSLVANQTYSVLPPSKNSDDPIAFVKHHLGNSRSLDDVTRAVMKYAEHMKAFDPDYTPVTTHQRQVINAIMIQNKESLALGKVSAVMTQLRDALNVGEAVATGHQGLADALSHVRITAEPQACEPRPPTRTTSSPKRGGEPRELPKKLQNRHSSYLCESFATMTDTSAVPNGSYNYSSMKEMKSPDVSAIFSSSQFS